MELDERSQLYANKMNIGALIEQVKIIQAEQQVNIGKIHNLQGQVAMMATEIAALKQMVFVMKAMGMGHGPTIQ
jgi:hypothetical protein